MTRYTLQEIIDLGRRSNAECHGGMPWSFELEGFSVTHERDDCYIVNSVHKVGPGQELVIEYGEIVGVFAATYEPA